VRAVDPALVSGAPDRGWSAVGTAPNQSNIVKHHIAATFALFLAAGIGSVGEALAQAGSAAQPAESRAPRRLRVLSYNIHHAAGVDGKLDLGRIAGVIRAARPDIVALQEVDREVGRSGKVDEVAKLAELTGLHGLFSKSIPLGGGAYGNAVLTRLPVAKREALPLPGREPRSALVATLRMKKDDPATEFTFFATHFPLQEKNRVECAAKIAEWLKAKKIGTALLAGDLNACPASKAMAAMFRDWTNASGATEHPTIPVDAPKSQIDYVLFRPAGEWKVVSVEVLGEAVASDHRPILAVLERVGQDG
jgi:endonuclease/exonuclease/phosphatase family metal-dependent hydrolase